ncbi:MAG: hypothetical protein QXW72_04510 [Conexivisphaerales archaeon]
MNKVALHKDRHNESILVAIRDSVYTISKGKPSLANRIEFFSFARVRNSHDDLYK